METVPARNNRPDRQLNTLADPDFPGTDAPITRRGKLHTMTIHSNAPRTANVLLVEDNEADVALTRVLFEHEGVEVALHTVEDGDQALNYLEGRPPYDNAPRPDLILMDLSLPRVDGRTVIGHMQQHPAWRTIPVVVLSGLDVSAPQADPPPRGVQAYITKPIHYETLREVVDRLPGLKFETQGDRHYLLCRD